MAGSSIPDQIGCDGMYAFTADHGAAWASMQNVDWKIIPSANYNLPADAPTSTCN